MRRKKLSKTFLNIISIFFFKSFGLHGSCNNILAMRGLNGFTDNERHVLPYNSEILTVYYITLGAL